MSAVQSGPLESASRHTRPFVGRRDELSRLRSLLAEHRVVTLMAGPGFGKTRLALELAADGSAVFCSLAACATPEDVCAEVVGQLRLPPPAGTGEQLYAQVGRALAQRGHRVVVLDNLEQVSDGIDRLLAAWLAAGTTAFLVTSRRRVGVPEEHVVPLDALPIRSESQPRPRGGDAVDLFYARASRSGPALDGTSLDDVLAIVRALEGIPLAIELAASRLEVLSLKDVRARLGDRFRLLRDPTREGRHATLWNALDGSWQLLAATEQRVLRWLSVFAGGLDADAAVGVIGPGTGAALDALVDMSLVRVEEQAARRRYFLFEVVREFAALHLDEAGERDEALSRHAAWYTGQALALASGIGRDRRDVESIDRLLAEERNLDAALVWVLKGPADAERALLALSGMRGLSWAARALYTSVRHLRWFDDVLRYAEPFRDDPRVRAAYARVRFERGTLHLRHLHLAEAGADSEWALAEAERMGDTVLSHDALAQLATWSTSSGRLEHARDLYARTLAVARILGDPTRLGWSLARYGVWLVGRHDVHGEETLREGLDHLRDAGAEYYEARALTWLGYGCMVSCRLDEADALLERGLALTRRLHARDYEAEPLLALATTRHLRGDLAGARSAYLDTLRVSRETGVRQLEAIILLYLAVLAGEADEASQVGRCLDEAAPVFMTATDTGSTSPLSLIAVCSALAGRADAARTATEAFLGLHDADERDAHRAVVRVVLPLVDGADGPALQDARHVADELRLAPSASLRIELRALDALIARADRQARTWRVHPSGASFAPPGEAAVDLSRRPVVAALCATLARARIEGVEAATYDELVAATWPGERLDPAAARARLHTALRVLRDLGLPIAQARGRGWFLDPSVLVAWADD